jgi:lysozyme family protein
MMKTNLENCIKLTFGAEGGYVNHPRDPGGPTKYGITQATLANYRHTHVTASDVQHLGLSEASAILDVQYWRKVWGDDLPKGIDYALFDYAVNSGPGQAVKAAQAITGMDRDGIMGAFTLNAIKATDPAEFIKNYQDARLKFLKGLSTWSTFGRGWEARVKHVKLASLAMLEKAASTVTAKVRPENNPVLEVNDVGTAPPRDTRTLATPAGQASITATASSLTGTIVAAGGFLLPYADNPNVKLGLIALGVVCAGVTIVAAIAAVIIQRVHIENGNPI